MRRPLLVITIALVVVLLGGVATAAWVKWEAYREEALLLERLNVADPEARAEAFYHARHVKRPESVQRLIDAFRKEQHPEVLGKAGYAVMYTQDPRGLPLLMERVDEGPDREARAEFMVYIARYEVNEDGRTKWLTERLESEASWLRLGAAAGLMYLGRAEGGAKLIALGADAPEAQRRFAVAQLQKVVRPMTETVAYPIAWPDDDGPLPDTDFWEALSRFWNRHGQERLLEDVLFRLFGEDENWHELKRLLHAREYAERWLK